MDTLVLTGAMLIDGTGAEPVRGQAVVVEGDRITQVVDAARAPRGRLIDLAGCTLLPGLINCHVHLCFGGEPDPFGAIRDEPHGLTALKVLRRAQDTLEAGVTTVRDLGGRDYVELAVRRGIAEGLYSGPRILGAGKPVCMTGGHGHFVGREADGPDEVRKAVREQLKAGADCIKLIATGGVMTPGVNPGSQQLSDAELHAGIEEAHKAGRKVAAHAHGANGAKAAILAGIDSIEHGSFLTDEIIQLMVERNTFYSVTLCSAHGFLSAPSGAVADWATQKAIVVDKALADSFRRAFQAGVRIVLGTDAGTPFNRHGDNAREIALMVKYGFPPIEALKAATRNGAELLGRLDELGTIEVGKAADLVLCQGDVATDVELLCNSDNIRLVIQAGQIVQES